MTACQALPRVQAGESTFGRGGDVRIAIEPPDSPEARWCLGAYADELGQRFRFSLADSAPLHFPQLTTPAGILLIVRRDDQPIGCCGLKVPSAAFGEVKRLWIHQDARGFGLGRRLLRAVEVYAAARGLPLLRLDTHSSLSEARALYQRCGYREVAAFNTDPYAQHWYAKELCPLD